MYIPAMVDQTGLGHRRSIWRQNVTTISTSL
jgi:hypothetical protein